MKKLSAISFQLSAKKGVVLILTFIIMTALTAITVGFLYMTSTQLRGSAYDTSSSKAFWLAEAGLQKAIWNLMTPVANGGQGEDWTTTGTTESLGDGSYTVVVGRWDFALADNGASASASSQKPGHPAANTIDGRDPTYWESASEPTPGNPEEITITFPYTLTINKARFYLPSHLSQRRPIDYSWQVSTDGISFTTVATRTNNNNTDVTDTFTAEPNVNYLKLRVTRIESGSPGPGKGKGGPPENGVAIGTLETIGSKITSTGAVGVINRKIEQTVVVDDTTGTAYDGEDWDEIIPAI